MQQLFRAGLLAAAFGLWAQAIPAAAQVTPFCRNNPTLEQCVESDGRFTPGQPAPGQGQGGYRPPPQRPIDPGEPGAGPSQPNFEPPPPGERPRRPRPPPPDFTYDDPPPPPRGYRPPPSPPGYDYDSDDYCFDIGRSLRAYGYRRVRPLDCEGRFFIYRAQRGPYRYEIRVRARSGRIDGVRRLR